MLNLSRYSPLLQTSASLQSTSTMCAMGMHHGSCHVLHGQRFEYTSSGGDDMVIAHCQSTRKYLYACRNACRCVTSAAVLTSVGVW